MRKAERAVVVGILVVVAVALRWAFVATANVSHPLRADAGEFATCAENLVEHGVYSSSHEVPPLPDSFRSPGYPLFLAGCRLVGGSAHWMALAIGLQVLLGGLTVLLTYRLARAWLGFGGAVLAAALCALSPHLVAAGAYVLSECVTTFLVVTGLWLVAGEATPRPARIVSGGAVLGAAVLCNGVLLFVPFVVVLVGRSALGRTQAILLLVCSLVPTAAWTARNHAQTLARTESQRFTASISHGSYPGMVFADPALFGMPYREDPEQPMFGASWSNLTTVLTRRVAADPWRYASWYLLEKPVWLWGWDLVQGHGVLVYDVFNNPYEQQPVMAASSWLMHLLHLPVMLLGAAAALWNAVRGRVGAARALGVIVMLGTLVYMLVIPDPRYLQPFRPLVFVLAAGALTSIRLPLRQWLRGKRRATSCSAENTGARVALDLPTTSRAAPPSS